jgi:hypothetical protein
VTNAGITSIDGKITACNTGAVVLAAGSAAIGKLAANTGVDICDVDVTSCALPTGAATSALQTSSEAILTTIDADTGAIKTAVEAIDNAVDGNYLNVNANIAGTDIVGGAGAVAAGVQRVTLASDDPAVTDLAALEVLATGIDADTDAIKTSVQIMDDWDSGDTCKVTIQNKSQIGPADPVIDSYTQAAINLAAGNNQVLVSSAANKQIWVYGITFTVNVAGTVSFQDEDDTAITGIMPIGVTGGMAISPSGNFSMPIWKLATDKDLEVDVVTSEIDGFLTYAIVSV